MSIECLNQALKVKGLTPTKKFILVILGNYADEKGTCYPSYRHIADIVGLKDTKGVQRAIKEFEQKGYLTVQHRVNDKGAYTSNRYHLSLAVGSETPRGDETLREGVQEPFNTKEDTKTNTKPNDDNYIHEFEIFWKYYPRKIGKYQASISFGKYDEKHYSKIIYATKVFAQENINTEEKFIPHATTFLNQQRYLDYLEKPIINKNLNNLAG